MNLLLKHTFIRFAIVGGFGFLVDLISMVLLSLWLPHLTARGFAFWIAASSNWWWNRHITFTDAQPTKHKKAAAMQWMQFLGGSVVAFIPNWGCYLFLMSHPPAIIDTTFSLLWPYLAMIPGVLVGMILNYVFSRFWVFTSINTPKGKPTE
ncbi:GtrA family protein [Marinomonas profundimaris]|uniref:Polysaccharide synthesis protein GtrA n=1 Tax=Marinomonas profundimaris TaxID=1208321 RepID=W1RWX7_9GAMM|nr:GtrA family protein [Marinomonas profundimaris]ETI61290.1 polysaccharide synthesis protein GtrA [Marinomonas profundimaris]